MAIVACETTLSAAEVRLRGPMERCKWLVASADLRVQGRRRAPVAQSLSAAALFALRGPQWDALERRD